MLFPPERFKYRVEQMKRARISEPALDHCVVERKCNYRGLTKQFKLVGEYLTKKEAHDLQEQKQKSYRMNGELTHG